MNKSRTVNKGCNAKLCDLEGEWYGVILLVVVVPRFIVMFAHFFSLFLTLPFFFFLVPVQHNELQSELKYSKLFLEGPL